MENRILVTMVNGKEYAVVIKKENIDDIVEEYDTFIKKGGFITVETVGGRSVSINKKYIVSIEILD
ncbi:hypothetical protein [Staphylococcus equorum]|uniref:Uncharacterized protein n=1 Tax=Staphylococcus equorum TaxID=246432 RepID=A0AAP7LUT6_9STAP|nr:hypothetical protein [Staphylococcus equorum]OEK58834.1 hypothetical protein ASS94_01385 [Staphylococcus equorum]